jgi:opacity protein-like surface antigen
MRTRIVKFALLVAFAAQAAGAQSPWTFSIGGGANFPTEGFRNTTSAGWHVLGSVGLGSVMEPLGLRLDLAYTGISGVGPAPSDVSLGTLNGTYRLPMTDSPLSPYLIAGVGGYRAECGAGVSCATSTNFGWNVGVGTNVAVIGADWFVETRLHSSRSDRGSLRLLLLTLGYTF